MTPNITNESQFLHIDMESIFKLAIPLICITVIVWLFLSYSKPRKELPANVHVLYISGYAVLIIIALVDYICTIDSEYNSLINMISFGATLSSLIMSVVAIIFTIVSGKNGEAQLGKITQATHELKETANKLTEFNSIAETIKTELTPSIKKLEIKLNDVDSKLLANSKKVEENCSITSEIRDSLAAQKEKIQAIEKQDKQVELHSSDAICLVESGSFLGNIALLACLYSKEKDKAWDVEAMGSMFKDDSLQYVYGYLIATSTIDVISFVGQFPQITCVNYDEDIKERLMSQITSFIKDFKISEQRANVIKDINTMQEYFGITPTKFE